MVLPRKQAPVSGNNFNIPGIAFQCRQEFESVAYVRVLCRISSSSSSPVHRVIAEQTKSSLECYAECWFAF